MEHLSLQKTYPRLLSHMKAEGYAPHTIHIVEYMVEEILAICAFPNEQTYIEYEIYLRKKHPNSCIRSYISSLNKIKRFDLQGLLTRPYQCVSHQSAYDKLSPYYVHLINMYSTKAQSFGLKRSSIDCITGHTSVFFFYLQSHGINDLFDTSEDVVVSFFTQGQFGKRGYCTMSHIRSLLTVLSTCVVDEGVDRAINLLPDFPRRRRIYNYLTKDEISKIKEALSDESPFLSLRDKAIGRLALYTGMRTSDLASLRIDNIDWNQSLINLRTKKNGREIVIPLTAYVGNAIYEYITLERGFSEIPEIFLLSKKWAKPLSRGNLYYISKRILKAAGINETRGREGFHLFRHHFGTALLEKEVDGSIISNIMGHASITSTQSYYDIDFAHLKECGLSIESFPVNLK